MTIYLWRISEDYPEKLIGRYERERSPDSYLFDQGVELSNDQIANLPIIKFTAKKEQLVKYDCLVNSTAIPVVNDRLANLLEELADNDIQLFDVKIECADGELKGYKIVNVVHKVSAIDHQRSIYSTIKMPRGHSVIGNIKKLFLKDNALGSYQFARDEESKSKLLASQVIYDAFKREKITGVWLATPNEFYDLVHGRS